MTWFVGLLYLSPIVYMLLLWISQPLVTCCKSNSCLKHLQLEWGNGSFVHNCLEALFCLAVGASTLVCGACTSCYALPIIVHTYMQICRQWPQGGREFNPHFKTWPEHREYTTVTCAAIIHICMYFTGAVIHRNDRGKYCTSNLEHSVPDSLLWMA